MRTRAELSLLLMNTGIKSAGDHHCPTLVAPLGRRLCDLFLLTRFKPLFVTLREVGFIDDSFIAVLIP